MGLAQNAVKQQPLARACNGSLCSPTVSSTVHRARAANLKTVLAVFEARSALLDKGGHAFLLVAGREKRVKQATLE
jgi:hypothetical protein